MECSTILSTSLLSCKGPRRHYVHQTFPKAIETRQRSAIIKLSVQVAGNVENRGGALFSVPDLQAPSGICTPRARGAATGVAARSHPDEGLPILDPPLLVPAQGSSCGSAVHPILIARTRIARSCPAASPKFTQDLMFMSTVKVY